MDNARLDSLIVSTVANNKSSSNYTVLTSFFNLQKRTAGLTYNRSDKRGRTHSRGRARAHSRAYKHVPLHLDSSRYFRSSGITSEYISPIPAWQTLSSGSGSALTQMPNRWRFSNTSFLCLCETYWNTLQRITDRLSTCVCEAGTQVFIVSLLVTTLVTTKLSFIVIARYKTVLVQYFML